MGNYKGKITAFDLKQLKVVQTGIALAVNQLIKQLASPECLGEAGCWETVYKMESEEA